MEKVANLEDCFEKRSFPKKMMLFKKKKRRERCQSSIIFLKIKIVHMVGLKKVVYGFWPDFEHLFLALVSLINIKPGTILLFCISTPC